MRKISIPYPFAAEQEVFVPVLRPFFGFYGQKPEALVPANHWIAFIIAEISLNFQEVAPPVWTQKTGGIASAFAYNLL